MTTSVPRGTRRRKNEHLRYKREFKSHTSKLNKYQTYDEIVNYLKALEKKFAGIIHLGKLGVTTEKRTLYAVHLGQRFPKRPHKGHPKAVIVIDAGIHAREWITVSSALCLIVHLATYYESDAFLQKFHWIILPLVNADGYEYSWKTDRLWRKTRSKPPNAEIAGDRECVGVDPNRNWGTHWGEKGVQRYNVCTEVYAGPYPFSEPEVAALSDIIEYYREHVALHISLHAFSQIILSPFGYKGEANGDHKKQALVMKAGVDAIKATSGLNYKYGSIYEAMYAASGSSIDFIYEALGVKETFVIELRDTGKFGFVLPQREILPTCKESIAAIIAMAKETSRAD
ncbi:carboxypeptidase B-like isoform X2 [Paramacrobiotus metropolitanus]|nr:carboxypeptidase B-like isoform X2 [Paramacrobiotus metropolitanus]